MVKSKTLPFLNPTLVAYPAAPTCFFKTLLVGFKGDGCWGEAEFGVGLDLDTGLRLLTLPHFYSSSLELLCPDFRFFFFL